MKERKLTDEIGEFVAIPDSLWDENHHLRISAKALSVMCALRHWGRHSQSGNMPRRDDLMKMAGIGNERTLASAIKELLRTKWMRTRKNFGATRNYVIQVPPYICGKTATNEDQKGQFRNGGKSATNDCGKTATNIHIRKESKKEILSPLTPLSGGRGAVSGSDIAAKVGHSEARLTYSESEAPNAGAKTSPPVKVKSGPNKGGSETPKIPVKKTPEFNRAVQDVIDLWYETHRVEKGQRPVDAIANGRKALELVAVSYDTLEQFTTDAVRVVNNFFKSGVASFGLIKLCQHWVALKEGPVLLFLKKKEEDYYA
jgi:hypothetical protein